MSESGRGRDAERRFQNPASQTQRPIQAPRQGYAVLLGVWLERGDESAALIALDAYRRLDRNTRFSLFMPLSLLEKAVETGFARHRNQAGEVIYAFRPTELPRYVETLVDNFPLRVGNQARRTNDAEEEPHPVINSSDSSITNRTFDLVALLGAADDNDLIKRIKGRIATSEADLEGLDQLGLLAALAEHEGISFDRGNPSAESAFELAALLDERVPLMLSIWSYLGNQSTPPASHREFLERLHEDDSLVGKSPPNQLPELVLNVIIACDQDISADDLDVLLEGDQPTRFCYELIQAHLENLDVDREELETPETDEDDEQDEDEPQTFEPIDASVKTMSVRTLFELVDADRLNLQPLWQRKDVWSLKKKRELIKSLLLGIPIPSIIIHRQGGEVSIIDGKQRLTSIVKFLRNEFKLPNFNVPGDHPLYGCRGAWFSKEGKKSLPDDIRTDLELQQIPALEFRAVPEKRLRNIFHLYNVSGTRLNAAEIRNAVYQKNRIHRVAYILAGEARPAEDLGTGDYERQLKFTTDYRATLPSKARYAAVDFLSRYLGYSRAAQRDPAQPFRLASTSVSINRYFDYASLHEVDYEVAREIIQVFRATERLFDIDDERLPFYRRDDKGRRKFNALVATSNMIASKFLLAVINAGLASEDDIASAVREVKIAYPENQQRATIWNYQARLLLGLRATLGIDIDQLPGDQWVTFFRKMQFAQLPDEEGAT